ncbi:MAG: DnaD domain protein [Firmicutes bacterium]|nr:DnaD domain protein [Bacillota bacterium]
MSFLIETTDIDLGDTSIENIFINDFMPMANGTYVKVYLLGYKYANDNDPSIKVNNETIAKHLNIPLEDVLNAWEFWERKGIIKKIKNKEDKNHNYSIEFLNLKQLYINNVIKPNAKQTKAKESSYDKPYVCSPQDLVEANKIPSINEMFNEIRIVIRRHLNPNEHKKILEWVYNYNMSTDVIVEAFKYSSEKRNKRNISYVHGIIKNWYDDGITNIEQLQEYFGQRDVRYQRYNRITKALGIQGNVTDAHRRLIDKWFDEWNFTMEVILRACDETIKIQQPNLKYVNGILSKWHEEDIKTLEDIETRIKKRREVKQSNTNNKGSNVNKKKIKTKFHNFEQRTSKYSAKELEDKIRWKFNNNK